MKMLNERIKEFNRDRNPKILKYKYKFMRENAFRFYRGTSHLFYEDLAKAGLKHEGPPGWICGDLHLFLKTYTETLKSGKPEYIEPATSEGIVKDFLKAAARRREKNVLTKRTFLRFTFLLKR